MQEKKFTSVKVISFLFAFYCLLIYSFNVGNDSLTNRNSEIVSRVALKWTVIGFITKLLIGIFVYVFFFIFSDSVEIYPVSPFGY